MASFFYVIVPARVAKDLGLDTVRQKIPGGCFLLTQKDFVTMPEETLSQRVASFGGVLVTEAESLQILNGVIKPPIWEPESELSPEEEIKESIEPVSGNFEDESEKSEETKNDSL